MTIDELKRAVRMTTDEQGEPAILIPLNIWKGYLEEIEPQKQLSQKQRILALFKEWDEHPEDNGSEEWWTKYDEFMKNNRFRIPEHDFGFGKED